MTTLTLPHPRVSPPPSSALRLALVAAVLTGAILVIGASRGTPLQGARDAAATLGRQPVAPVPVWELPAPPADWTWQRAPVTFDHAFRTPRG